MGEKEHKSLKKVTKVLLSISFFSLFFIQVSNWQHIFHSFKFYLSTLPFQLFTHSIDKNCMFLLCNGLLIFVAKDFGLINFSRPKSKSSNHTHEPNKDYLAINPQPQQIEVAQEMPLEDSTNQNALENEEHGLYMKKEKVIVKIPTQELMIDEDGEEQQGDHDQSGILSTKWVLVDQDNGREEEKRVTNSGFSHNIEGDQDEQEAEQLNKKFEEFIRKMKEELRIEARKKLVMV